MSKRRQGSWRRRVDEPRQKKMARTPTTGVGEEATELRNKNQEQRIVIKKLKLKLKELKEAHVQLQAEKETGEDDDSEEEDADDNAGRAGGRGSTPPFKAAEGGALAPGAPVQQEVPKLVLEMSEEVRQLWPKEELDAEKGKLKDAWKAHGRARLLLALQKRRLEDEKADYFAEADGMLMMMEDLKEEAEEKTAAFQREREEFAKEREEFAKEKEASKGGGNGGGKRRRRSGRVSGAGVTAGS